MPRIDFCFFGSFRMENAGLALLEFRARITRDSYVALANWNSNDCDPCKCSFHTMISDYCFYILMSTMISYYYNYNFFAGYK